MRRLLALPALSLLAVAGVVLATAACGGTHSGSSGSQPVKVGVIVSLTGNYAPLGSEDRKSIELAVQQLNDKGGLLGRKIELTVKDDRSQPDQSVLAFNELKGAGVAAVIGSPFSNSALATIPQVDRAKIPYLSLTPADEQVKPVHPYVFVVPATAGTYADRILQYYQAQGYSKVAVAYDTKSSYAQAGFAGMQAKADSYGVRLVASEEFQTTTTEFSAVLNHVKSAGAQALTVWATGPPAVAFAKQYPTANLGIPLMFTGAQASTLWLQPTGAAAEGVFVASSIGVVERCAAGRHPEADHRRAGDPVHREVRVPAATVRRRRVHRREAARGGRDGRAEHRPGKDPLGAGRAHPHHAERHLPLQRDRPRRPRRDVHRHQRGQGRQIPTDRLGPRPARHGRGWVR